MTVLSASVAASASPVAGDQAGDIERVPLVLGSPVAYRGLPFDEPFYFTGRTGSLVDSVGVRLAPAAGAPDCAAPIEDQGPDVREGSWRRVPGPSPDSFYIRMDELPPDRSYRLCVSTRSRPDADEIETLRRAWRGAIDSTFRHLPTGWTPDADDLAALQAVLRARVGAEVTAAHGSLLDASVTPEGFAAAVPATRRLVAAQLERELAIEDLERAARAAAAALETLRTDSAFPGVAALRTASDSRLRAFASLHRDGLEVALGLASVPARRFEAVFRGDIPWTEVVGAVPRRPALADLWEGDAAVARARRLGEALERSRDLARAVRAFAASPETLDPAGVTAGDAARLALAAATAADEAAAAMGHLDAAGAAIARRSAALDETVAQLLVHERATISVEAHTRYDLETSARNHVSADFGVLYLPGLGAATPVLGANFYFRPVNRDRGPGGHPLRRFSLGVGVTTTSLEVDGLREDLFGSLNLSVGIGARVTRLLRLSGGAVILRAVDSAPIDTDGGPADASARTHIAFTPYVAVTLDLVVRSLVSSLFGEVF